MSLFSVIVGVEKVAELDGELLVVAGGISDAMFSRLVVAYIVFLFRVYVSVLERAREWEVIMISDKTIPIKLNIFLFILCIVYNYDVTCAIFTFDGNVVM